MITAEQINKIRNQNNNNTITPEKIRQIREQNTQSVTLQQPRQQQINPAANILQNATKVQSYNEVVPQQSPNQQPTFNTLGEAKKYAEENNLNVAKVPETQKPSLLSIQTPRQQATKGQQGITQAISNKTANMDLEEYEKYINEEYKNLEKYKNLKSAAYATGNWKLAGQYEILAQNAEFAKELNEMKKKYDDSTFFANYNLGQMQIDYNEAMNKYFTTNSEQDLLKAEQLRRKINYYMERAEKVGEGNWITKDFAEYAPQMVEQTKAGLTGALGGAVVGGGAGSVIPGAGTAAGAIKGAGIGYAGGVAAFSYDQMRGAAYSELLDLGVPADISKAVAKDTALWQSIIEGAGAGVDVATLGVGKLFSKGAKTAAQITAKKMIANALKAYGWNILSETAEEATQEMVAIKQEEKALEKAGIEDTRTFAEKRDRIIQAGLGGLKISLITGAGNTIGNITVSTINNSTLKQTDAFYDNYIEEVKNSDLSEKDKNDLIKDAEEGRTTAKAVIEEAIKTNKPITGTIETQNNVENAQNLQKTAITGNEIQEYATKKTKDGTTYVFNQNKKFVNPDGTKMTPKQMYDSIVGEEINVENGGKIYILKTLPKKNLFQELFKRHPRFFDNINNMKQLNRMTNENIIDLIKNSNLKQVENDIDNRHAEQGIETFDTREVIFYDGENAYNIELSIANLKDGRKVAYAKKYFGLNEEMTKKIKEDETLGQQSQVNQKPLLNNIIASKTNNVNNQENLLPTTEQLQAQDQKQAEEAYNTLNMKKPKLERIAELTEEQAQLPTMTYKQRADRNTPYRRKFWDNIESSKIVSKDVKEQVNMTNYQRKHNADVLEKMQERLDTEPMRVAQEWFNKDIKKATEQDIALGAILLERYQAEGRIAEAVDVVEKLGDIGTEAGRTVQMYSIFQRLAPEGMMMYQQRKLNSALETLTAKQTGKWVEQNKDKFKLTEDDAIFITAKVQEAQNAPTERQKQIALAEIETRINDKLPPEAGQSVKAFRRIAMLFNPKTQVRNITGNITVMPLNYVTDLVSTGIDKAVAKKTGVRTTALPNVKTIGKGFKKGASETIDDYRRGIRTTPTGSRYEIQNNAKSFNENTNSKLKNAINRKLNGIDRILSTVLEVGDRPFYEAAYQNALEGQMKANNVTEPTQDMIDIASNVALSQTWQDNNNYTQAVLGIRNAFNKININGFGLGDLIIPFAKTPANLTKAMIDYSPAGFIPAWINYNDMQKAISRGDMTPMQQKKFVTSVGKAIAGTLLYTLAYGLVQGGYITGSADEDKDVANFEKNVLGIQPYSIKIGDKTFTYNWAQPLATPFAIMADAKKMSAEDASFGEMLVNSFKVAGDQLVANSFLQGIQELLSSEYGNESAMDNLVGAIMDLPTQFTPTLFGQIATQFDKTKRQTFESGNTLGTMINEVKNKLPGARNTLAPQVNTFGEEIQNYGGDNNPFNVFLNPGNVSSTNASDTQKELYALYEVTKDKTIFPRQAPYSVSGGGEKFTLSSQERADYQKTSGQYVTEQLDALFNSEFYKSLEDSKKVDVVAKIVGDADTAAKDKWVDTEATEDLAELRAELEAHNIPMMAYYNAWIAKKGVEGTKNWKGETISGSKKKNQITEINKAVGNDLTAKQKEALYGILNISGY